MESRNGQSPWTWFDPEGHEEQGETIPNRGYNGWVKITRSNRKETVVKVETVRFLGSLTGDIVYPPRPPGFPLYDDLFLQGRKECIPEDEALAWLEAHHLPLPGREGESVSRPTVPQPGEDT